LNAERKTTRDSVPLAHREYGSGLQTLLLIHGWACSGRYWNALVGYLRPYYRIVTVDLRGFGDSPKPVAGYDYADYVADLAVLVTTLALPRCVVVGHSMGGSIAMQFALAYPERLAALVIIGSGAYPPHGAGILAALSGEPSDDGRNDSKLRDIVAAWFHVPNPNRVSELVDMAHATPVEVRMEALRRHIAHDLRNMAGKISLPTLILHGAHDRTRPLAEAQALQQSIQGAELHVIAGAAHMPHIENPAETSAALFDFLDRRAVSRHAPPRPSGGAGDRRDGSRLT
jgi:pimeloyl-ACP methyl ester carboxylesterase